MKELPKKDKSTFIVGFWGDTWIASELHKIDKIKEGKFGETMDITLKNNGPMTIFLDTKS